ncbi:Sentrin-specific protease [Dictyocoela muelleri]|nr:Sentrin-specific protease [Dictyocoela muelleri]
MNDENLEKAELKQKMKKATEIENKDDQIRFNYKIKEDDKTRFDIIIGYDIKSNKNDNKSDINKIGEKNKNKNDLNDDIHAIENIFREYIDNYNLNDRINYHDKALNEFQMDYIDFNGDIKNKSKNEENIKNIKNIEFKNDEKNTENIKIKSNDTENIKNIEFQNDEKNIEFQNDIKNIEFQNDIKNIEFQNDEKHKKFENSKMIIEISDSDTDSYLQKRNEVEKKVESRPKRQFLNKEELKSYLRTLRDDIIIIKFKMVINYDDFRRLNPHRWLNGTVINFYFHMIQKCAEGLGIKVFIFSTFFYTKLNKCGYEGVNSWITEYNDPEVSDYLKLYDNLNVDNNFNYNKNNKDLFTYDYLFMPIHLSNHWIFVCIDIKRSTIEMYDSLQNTNPTVILKIKNFLQKIKNYEDWKIIIRRDIPVQQNGNDCGIYVCLYARFRIVGWKMNFNSYEVCDFRRKIAHEISVGEIVYFLNHRF